MAAFSAARATNRLSGNGSSAVAREGGGGGEAAASENLNVGPATVLEFFQMCDIENKGFITQRDMQVRLPTRG